jgi:hypothetical protein
MIVIFQETVVRMAVKLLSPPMPSDSPGTGDANHYLTHMHMLNAVLSCLCHVGTVHILSLYGMVSFSSLFPLPLLLVHLSLFTSHAGQHW